ncbi:Para-nitrobenzyl esterase [Lachnellula suecica]|uniref:Carboxylic ester hydrolase n=1 Tax=Lachnellula suecica TaxID=602035 RepID=A0A8T9C239_9HELO|nr:Para-nitrobenzyl esterase [Lachnellula suecica]
MHLFLRRTFLLANAFTIVQALPTVTIPAGNIQGTTCPNGANASHAVPYAAPPTGDLRWVSPQAYNKSFPASGYNATTLGASCIQFGTEFLETGSTSEDCLQVNIWTPSNATNTSKLPVKVWVYGGSDQAGGIEDPLYNGCNLAAHDTVLVSVNYRLGPLGFLSAKSAGITGNFGIEDIIFALEWVQSNIDSFGGDPRKVLLFGQSTGALDTFIISTLSKAPSIMNAAVWESGVGPQLATSTEYDAYGTNFTSQLNCSISDAACLRSATPSALQSTFLQQPNALIYSGLNLQFAPFVDGVIIPAQPWSIGPKVPMIFGTMADEGNILALGAYPTTFTNLTESDYTDFLSQNFGAAASLVSEQYPLSDFDASPFPIFTVIGTGTIQMPYLSSNAPSTSKQYSRLQLFRLTRATHTSEIPFVFGNGNLLPQQLPVGNCSFTPQEWSISENLIAAWTAMAATGNPSVQGGLKWPQWNSCTSTGVNILNETTVGAVDYSSCSFWDMINAEYLNYTTPSAFSTGNGTACNASSQISPDGSSVGGAGSTGLPVSNGVEKEVKVGVWSLVLILGIAMSLI